MRSRRNRITLRSAAVVATVAMASVGCGMMLAPAAAFGDETLEEIVVTAQRYSERLQDVPIAVTAILADDLAGRGIRQAGDVAAMVPNLLLNSPYGPEAQPTFTLRGVTTQDFSENQSSPVAMYVDEVYKPVGAVQALQTFDLDRVEVLRGPQGTLYGKNATGGAVSFYSRNPSLTDIDGYVTAGFGSYNAYSVQGAVGGPVIDNVFAVRAAAMYEKRDGWVNSVVPGVEPLNGVDAVAGRITALWKPNDDLTATLKLSASKSGGTPYGAHALNVDPIATGFTDNIGWFDNGAKYAVHKDVRNDSIALKIDWQVAAHAILTSVTGFDYGRWYEKSDDGGLPITVRLDDPNTYFSSVNSFSQEIRIASKDSGTLSWLAGLYYGRESTHATVQFHFFDGYNLAFWAPQSPSDARIVDPANPLFGFDEYNDFDQLKVSKAAFVNLTYAVTPTVTFRAGLRYTKDDITINHFYALEGGIDNGGPQGFAPDGGTTWWTQTIGGLPASRTFFRQGLAPQGPTVPSFGNSVNNVSGRIGIDWKPAPGILAYLSFSTGYRGAAFNGQAFNDPSELNFADPEKLRSTELGLKMDLWNKRATLNAAIFHYDYRNQQFLDAFTLPGGLGTGFHTVNAPKSRIDGAEVELRLKATEDLEIDFNAGALDSKYVDLTLHAGAFVDVAHTIPRDCCVGNKLIQAPPYNIGLGFNWRVARTGAGDLHLLLDGNAYGKQYFDAFNTERLAQDAYLIGNARVSLDPTAKRGLSVGVWIKNLADRKYLAYGLNQADNDTGLLGFDYALVGEPRTYGVDFGYKF